MLHAFLSANRDDLIDRCRLKVAQRRAPKATDAELEHGIPHFLDQLIKTLQVEQTPEPMLSREVSGQSGGEGSVFSEIGATAARHGRELLQHGFTVDQVVHDYGDLCQAITDLAFERETPVEIDEFRTLNRCLDNAIADAVTEFTYQRDLLLADAGTLALNERLGFFAHELRNLIQNATLAVTAIKAGNVGLAGATGAVLDRSLIGLRNLIDRSLADVRVTAGMPVRRAADSAGRVHRRGEDLRARSRRRRAAAGLPSPLSIRAWRSTADRDLLFSAVGNLLQNAFKFTERGHRSPAARLCSGRSRADRGRGPLRRPAAGRRGEDVSAVHAGQRGQIRPRPGPVDLPAQRRGDTAFSRARHARHRAACSRSICRGMP